MVISFVRQIVQLVIWERRRLGAIAHIGPDHAVALVRLVGLGLDAVLRNPDAAARSAYRGNCRRRRISSRDRCSAGRSPRCGRRTARRSDAGSDDPSCRRGPTCRGTRSAARRAASGARGSPSALTSRDIAAGIQYRRMSSPIGVPGPTRVRISFSRAVVMAPSRQNARIPMGTIAPRGQRVQSEPGIRAHDIFLFAFPGESGDPGPATCDNPGSPSRESGLKETGQI